MTEAIDDAANDDADLRRLARVTFGLPHLREGQLTGCAPSPPAGTSSP
jgi:hypothetical protein